MRPAKIVAIVIGALLILVSLGFLVSGVFLTWVGSHADSTGFLSLTENRLSTTGYAFVSPDLTLDVGSGEWLPGGGLVQLQVTPSGTAPIFVGIGPSDQVAAYLSGVQYDEVTNLGWFNSSVDLAPHEGGAPAAPPGQETFWVAQQEGSGSQSVQWNVKSGSWTAVVMNADGSAPVNVGLRLGARLGFLLPLGIGLTVAGVVLLAVGILLVVLGARRAHSPLQPSYAGGPAYGSAPPPYGGPQPPYGQQPPPYAQYTPPPYQPPVGQPPEGQAPAGEPPTVEPVAHAPGESPGTPPLS